MLSPDRLHKHIKWEVYDAHGEIFWVFHPKFRVELLWDLHDAFSYVKGAIERDILRRM